MQQQVIQMTSNIKSTALKGARLAQLTANSSITMLNGTILAIILVYVLRDLIPHSTLTAWLVCFIVLYIVRFMLLIVHKRSPAVTDEMLDKQLMQFRAGLIASGFLWGSASIFMYPSSPSHQIFFIFILAGLSAGCVVSYSVDFISAITFVILLLAPMLVRLFLGNSEIALAMTLSVLLYLAFMIGSIRHVNRSLSQNISARYDAAVRVQDIKQIAFYDELTNLPNRRLMIDRINHALALSTRTKRGGALLFLDLDNFKNLNDTLGHNMGDLLLKQVAERLASSVRASDTVARFGGDEFTIMLEDLSADAAKAKAQVEVITKQIFARLNLAYQLNRHQHYNTASIGVALFGFGDSVTTHEELLKNADIAMYCAKRAGRNIVQYYDLEMQKTFQAQAARGLAG